MLSCSHVTQIRTNSSLLFYGDIAFLSLEMLHQLVIVVTTLRILIIQYGSAQKECLVPPDDTVAKMDTLLDRDIHVKFVTLDP